VFCGVDSVFTPVTGMNRSERASQGTQLIETPSKWRA
jgi:hypothetical protein